MWAAPPRDRSKLIEISDSSVPPVRRIAQAPASVGKINLAPRGLVILVSYKDLAFQAENDSAAMSQMMNKTGYDYNGATGSARDYFIAQSNGQYQPVFDIVGPVTLPGNRVDYGGNSGGRDVLSKVQQMIVDACNAVDAKVDFTLYDNDGDNKIDFVYVLYAGIAENDIDGESDAVWSHNSSAEGKNKSYDGKKLANYACSGEIDGVTHERAGIGTISHEFGHVIGLPDYYDTDGSTNGSTSGRTPNEWSIMDYGCYNNGANTPPNYSLYDKEFMGWLTPNELTPETKATISLGTGYDEGYKIQNGDTVLYIENRQQTGWDLGLYSHGLIVWRLVYDASVWSNNRVNSDINNIRFTILPADGGYMVGWVYKDKGGGNYENLHLSTDDPYPGHQEKTSLKLKEGIELTEITEKDGVVSFKVNGGDVSSNISVQNAAYGVQKIMREGQIYIVRGDKAYTLTGQQTTFK